MRVGIMTSGGDCPGLNAVIRGAVLNGIKSHDQEYVGFLDGWKGVLEGHTIELPRHEVRGISKQGGTILGTSRTHPYDHAEGGPEGVAAALERHGLDALVAIGGEGTLAGAKRLADAGLPIVGVPKTIDNDLGGTDYTFGFDTAVAIGTEAIDRLRTTGESHHRCMIAEVMGRHAGWIALHTGMAAGAHAILIPEQKVSMAQIAEWVSEAGDRGRAPLVVVAEGFVPEDAEDVYTPLGAARDGRMRLGGIGERLAPVIEEMTGFETRSTTLGHIQRGGTPTAYDRVLATRMGMGAADLVADKDWGRMVALDGTDIQRVPLSAALECLKTVPQHRYDEASILFG